MPFFGRQMNQPLVGNSRLVDYPDSSGSDLRSPPSSPGSDLYETPKPSQGPQGKRPFSGSDSVLIPGSQSKITSRIPVLRLQKLSYPSGTNWNQGGRPKLKAAKLKLKKPEVRSATPVSQLPGRFQNPKINQKFDKT